VNGREHASLGLGACAKHWNERAVGRCGECGEGFCGECLVPPVRKRQPTRCIECALIAAGIRVRGAHRSNPRGASSW
jgi:hypothetical protein